MCPRRGVTHTKTPNRGPNFTTTAHTFEYSALKLHLTSTFKNKGALGPLFVFNRYYSCVACLLVTMVHLHLWPTFNQVWDSVKNPNLENRFNFRWQWDLKMWLQIFEIHKNPRGVLCVWKCKYLHIFRWKGRVAAMKKTPPAGKRELFANNWQLPLLLQKKTHCFFFISSSL